jgi:NADH dehydrogenase [ubiquinone] 1 alpha subcomplex assembly factor 7
MSYIPFPPVSPELFSVEIFGVTLALRWYALAYIAGLVAGWWLIRKALRTPRLWSAAPPMTEDQLERLLTWVIIGVILGGRIGYAMFYGLSGFLDDPLRVFRVWEGGMAFHGGFLGVAIAGLWFCQREGISKLSTGDLMAMVAPIGLFLGRIANFINALGGGLSGRGGGGLRHRRRRLHPPSEPDLRGALGGVAARHGAALADLAAGLAALAGGRHGAVSGRLRRRAVLRRILPPARCAIRDRGQSGRPRLAHRRLGADPGAGSVAADAGGGAVVPVPGETGMTPLADLLIRRIRVSGPITVADYMTECLLHPQHGYYATRDPFGAKGDFTTAPEISQMFGELLGLCLAQSWLEQGSPAQFTLAELGPGRGTMMADILRATRAVPGFHAAAEVVLVEASPTLRQVQARTLNHPARWVDAVADLPDRPLFLVANEFFDALPIRQFQREAEGWRERMIGLQGENLAFGLSGTMPTPAPQFAADPPGTIVELCPAAETIAETLGQRLRAHSGAALIIDYAGWRSKGDTLQALRQHRPEDPLANPGEADLTAHVDFEALARTVATARTGMTDQGTVLKRLGIDQRAARLAAGLTGAALESHRAAHHRLTDPGEMGSLFKMIAFFAPGAPPPPGFDPPMPESHA